MAAWKLFQTCSSELFAPKRSQTIDRHRRLAGRYLECLVETSLVEHFIGRMSGFDLVVYGEASVRLWAFPEFMVVLTLPHTIAPVRPKDPSDVVSVVNHLRANPKALHPLAHYLDGDLGLVIPR